MSGDRVLPAQQYRCRLCDCGDYQPKESNRLGGVPHTYLECLRCGVISLGEEFWLSEERERERYLLHANSHSDAGYLQFLSRAVDPLVRALSHIGGALRGVDYGCGPTPTASILLRLHGLDVVDYDPFFFPDTLSIDQQFDFLLCTEVIEHLRDPRGELERMIRLVREGGVIALMTEIWDHTIDFSEWSYLSDPTHITIYQPKSFQWIAERYNLNLEVAHRNVRLLTKNNEE